MELVDSREGDIILENKLHLYLHHLQYNTDFMYEWYKDIEEVKDIFNLDIEELDKKLWEIRDKIFPPNLFTCLNNSQVSIDIYKSIFDKFNSTLIYENIKDDNGKIVEGNTYEIDKIYYYLSVVEPDTKDISGYSKPLIVEFDKLSQFTDKMKFICDQFIELAEDDFDRFLNSVPIIFKNYYKTLGPDFCKSVSYRKYLLEEEYNRRVNNQGIDIQNLVYSNFQVGEKYLMSNIKEKLRNIYNSVNYKSTPKASDLENYFNIKTVDIKNPETEKKKQRFSYNQ